MAFSKLHQTSVEMGIFLTSRNVNNSCMKNFNGLSLPEHLLAIKKH